MNIKKGLEVKCKQDMMKKEVMEAINVHKILHIALLIPSLGVTPRHQGRLNPFHITFRWTNRVIPRCSEMRQEFKCHTNIGLLEVISPSHKLGPTDIMYFLGLDLNVFQSSPYVVGP